MKKIGLMLALLWVIGALSWASSPDARIKPIVRSAFKSKKVKE